MRAATSRTMSALGMIDRTPPPFARRRRASSTVAPTTAALALATATAALPARVVGVSVTGRGLLIGSAPGEGVSGGCRLLPAVTPYPAPMPRETGGDVFGTGSSVRRDCPL